MNLIKKILNKLITEADIQEQYEEEKEMNESMLRWNDRMVKTDERRLAKENKKRIKKTV